VSALCCTLVDAVLWQAVVGQWLGLWLTMGLACLLPCATGTHPAVVEVLEVAQLMDTCCRSGNFDEALDLRAFVNKARQGGGGGGGQGVSMLQALAAARTEPCPWRWRGPPAADDAPGMRCRWR
jgi:hypothetical protein